MTHRMPAGLFALLVALAVGCGTPSVAPAPPPPEPTPAPEATPAPPPEPTPPVSMATEPLAGSLCTTTGLDRLTDGRLLVTDSSISDSVALFGAEGLARGAVESVPLKFKSMEGPLPETIEDLAAVATRGDVVVLVGSFAHADGEGCPLPGDRAKILVGDTSKGALEWQHRLRMTPCAWNGSGANCRGRKGGLTSSVQECKAALFTSKITRQGDSVCEALVAAEAAIAAGTCGPGFAVAAATIVPTRSGKKLWLALRSPLTAAGETMLLRVEQSIEDLSALSFDRASYLALPPGFEIRGLTTDGDELLGAADGPDGGMLFSFSARDLDDGAAITPDLLGPPLPRGVQALSTGLSGPVALFGGTPGEGSCAAGPRVGIAAR